jgi:hypothetical protein
MSKDTNSAKDAFIGIRASTHLARAVHKRAAELRVSVSDVVRDALVDYLSDQVPG